MAVHDLIERVQVLRIDPDDVLLVRLSYMPIDEEETDRLVAAWREAFPAPQRIVFCTGDTEVEVLRAVKGPLGHHEPGDCRDCDALRDVLAARAGEMR